MIKKLLAASLLLVLFATSFAVPAYAISANKFNLMVDDLSKGTLNLNTDTIKAMLTNTAPVATNHCYADISGNELANGNGYVTGGATVAGTGLSNASGTESLAANATTWTSATGNMGPFRYVVYYDSTPASCKTLLIYYDNGSSITLNGVNSDTFTTTPTGNVLFILARMMLSDDHLQFVSNDNLPPLLRLRRAS